ncbi:uncharacterized protein LOC135495051 [Lineus longissimus]|uniref:uncharacterized protein LOC135495051 n=1 Tax=Lineus longissimus TaxID=88925 RepID=UPI00315CE4FE
MFDCDFNEIPGSGEAMSVEDRRFLAIVSDAIRQREDGHFEMPLPFREDELKLPKNRNLALKRLNSLKSKMNKNAKYSEDYRGFMKKLLDNGHAERVPSEELNLEDGTVCYIPHHGVYHPRKPNKIRVVFDCAAEYDGEALNKHLLRGPDMINNLTGALIRFRKNPIAFTCDIDGMFYQVGVHPKHRNYLRFFWWENGDLDKPLVEYCMTVHLFGATSSPGCANFALKATAEKFKDEFDPKTVEFIKRSFYVDDGLQSELTTGEIILLVVSGQKICARGGFNLHDYVCNHKQFVDQIPLASRAKDFQCIDLNNDDLPTERTLGIVRRVQSDAFEFQIEMRDKPLTRRGLLSVISSVYDPLGLVSPFVLKGKKILKNLCETGAGWDAPTPDDIRREWERWIADLKDLADVSIPRCYKGDELGELKSADLHHFSDASMEGYGQCSYVRLTDEEGRCDTALVMAKSRVTPSKTVTIPRLELTTAVTSARIAKFLDKELDYSNIEHHFYTDSQVVLGYIGNESRTFHIFVANRVQEIRDSTSPSNWRYVDTDQNPADYASRGMSVSELKDCSVWWKGPPFLKTGILPTPEDHHPVSPEDPELKKTVLRTKVDVVQYGDMTYRFDYYSSWFRLKRAVAICKKYMEKLRLKDREKYTPVTTEDLQQAETTTLRFVQQQSYSSEIETLKKQRDENWKGTVKGRSNLYSLDPFLDDEMVLRMRPLRERNDLEQHKASRFLDHTG